MESAVEMLIGEKNEVASRTRELMVGVGGELVETVRGGER